MLQANDLGFQYEFLPARSPDNDVTLLVLHGTGGTQYDLIPLGERLYPAAAILSPLGKVSENGMARFFRRLSPGVFDLDDLRFRTDELAEFVRRAVEAHKLNPHRVVAAGYSNGANIAASLLLLAPAVLRCAVLLRPMVPLVPQKLPNLDGVQVFISGGRQDEIVAPAEAVRLAEVLHESGATVSIHWAEAGHGLISQEIAAARDWLAAHIKCSAA